MGASISQVKVVNSPLIYIESAFLDRGEDESGHKSLSGHSPIRQANPELHMLNHKLFLLKTIRA